MIVTLGNRKLRLLPSHAVLLGDGSLVVADIHLGKATAFQERGLPIPEGHSASDLQRLTDLCRLHQAKRLVINGDLFHSKGGWSAEIKKLFEDWLRNLGIPVELVIGNHDKKLGPLPGTVECSPQLNLGGFRIVHDPSDAVTCCPCIAAHWHPVARIGNGRQRPLRMPCYLIRGSMLVLPSFGEFTGGQVITPQAGDRCFVISSNKVMEVPAQLLR